MLWSLKERNTSFTKVTPFSNGAFAIRSFYDFRKDSLSISVVYVSDGVVKKSLGVFVEEPRDMIIVGNILFVYNDKELYAVDIPTWKLKWSRKGDINQSFVLKDNELVSTRFSLEANTGKIVEVSKTNWFPYTLGLWGNALILDVLVDDENRRFLVDHKSSNIYKVIFMENDFLACTANLTDAVSYVFAAKSSGDLTICIKRCENGLGIYGFRLSPKVSTGGK